MDERDRVPPNSSEDAELTAMIEGRSERLKAAEEVRKALLARPRLSLRMQLYLGFVFAILLAVGIAGAIVVTTHKIEEKIIFLEIVNDYVVEIEQARRYEKNYFLYGSNLSDALESVYNAKRILDRNTEQLATIIKEDTRQSIFLNIEHYEDVLERLVELERKKQSDEEAARPDIEQIQHDVRKQGQKMVSLALDLMEKEKKAVSVTISRSRQVQIYLLVFLLVYTIFIAYFQGGRILRTIGRFRSYVERIAIGDFTPITPARRFRDEFTDLGISINNMIQELERHESILIQSHKMRAIGTLTAGVAHELNNPLNNITLTAHMLLEDLETLNDGERREMVCEVVEETDRAKSIVSNLLDFARETKTELEPLKLEELLEDTISLAANQLKLSGIKIDFQAIENLPRIHGDRQQLRQVFLNLILNAIAASTKKSTIRVLVLPADEPDNVAVKVIDYGAGIPKHIVDRIFDPFFTTKAKGKGTGLGLSVSQGIIAKHGGRIRVASQEGKGSTFTVTLPVTTLISDPHSAYV